jgi:hypothetical protein
MLSPSPRALGLKNAYAHGTPQTPSCQPQAEGQHRRIKRSILALWEKTVVETYTLSSKERVTS